MLAINFQVLLKTYWRMGYLKRHKIIECSYFYQLRKQSTSVELTSVRHPQLKRGQYEPVKGCDISFFEQLLGKSSVITDQSDLEYFNTDWLKTCRGSSSILLRPKSTGEVSEIMKYCYSHNLAVCPQGGNTGLVGGSVPVFDEVILSMSLMNNIEYFDEVTGIVTCQAGCILEKVDQYLHDKNFVIPLDLGSKGSCQIGGNVATNAGGLRLLRYGSLHGTVLGLEVVLTNGDLLDCMSSMRKDNTGYDLKQIFIGSEGTLGIITKVNILCYPKPPFVSVAFLGCANFENVLEILKISKIMLSEVLSSIEMMDNYALQPVEKYLHLNPPISSHPFYVLIEVSGSHADHNEEKLNKYLEVLMQKGLVSDGTVASEPSRIQKIWALRERITEALLYEGYTYKYDVSLPMSSYYDIVNVMRVRLGNQITRCCGYGHLGDGNMHLNMTSPTFDYNILNTIEPFVYMWTAERKGSISAEHGLGFKKRDYIHYSKSPSAVQLMKKFKGLFDPKGILNPYKVLPSV